MTTLSRTDVVGRRIVDVIISAPDKPLGMSDMSESRGFLRLDSGITIAIDAQPPLLPIDFGRSMLW
jgi:hypothetical protein